MASTQTVPVESVRTNLIELRRACEAEISNHQQNIDSTVDSFTKSLELIRSRTEQSAHNQVELGKLKAQLREVEDELVKALAVKTRREAKRMSLRDSLSETRFKVEELHKIVEYQRARTDEYAAILSRQSKALAESKEKSKETFKCQEEMQEAFTWYNRVLGFRIDGGHGVKFTFVNINRKCPSEEYSFTVRHSNDVYTLLDCSPHLNGTEELVTELNKSNGLFKFVRMMREKFLAAASGSVSNFIYQDQDTASISLSAPVSSISVDSRMESPLPHRESNRNIKKDNHAKGIKSPIFSPVSASFLRRSPRFLEKSQIEH